MRVNALAAKIHKNAVEKGFWDDERNVSEMLMLAVSELAEAQEEHRAGKPLVYTPVHRESCSLYACPLSDCIKGGGCGACDCAGLCKPEGVAVEIVDCIIRCLDTLAGMGVDVEEVIERKMIYNSTRPIRHGKAY